MNSGFYKPGIIPSGFGRIGIKSFPSIYNIESPVHTLHSKRSKIKENDDLTFDNSRQEKQKQKQSKIQPKTKHQTEFLELMRDNTVDILIAIGPAGTGKTMLACYAAVEALRIGNINKIVVTRPVVSVDEEIGFLPGGLESKMDPWTRPIFDVLRETYSAKDIEKMTEEGVIEIVPLGFMRGRTFKKSWIIADEMQNSSPTQMFMLATRIGEDSKMIITGDLNQSDYNPKSNGLLEIYNKVRHSERILGSSSGCVRYIELDKEDVQRSRAAKTVLDIYEMKPDVRESVELSSHISKQAVSSASSSIFKKEESENAGIAQYDESNPCSNEFEYFDVHIDPNSTDISMNQTASCLSKDKIVEWVDIRDDDAALIPLKHIKQLLNFKENR